MTREGQSVSGRGQLHLVHAVPAADAAMSVTVPIDRLFRKLDGHSMTLGGTRWQVNVYGIRHDGRWRWVQIAVVGPRSHTLTLKLTPADDGARALGLVAAWLSRPLVESADILTVS